MLIGQKIEQRLAKFGDNQLKSAELIQNGKGVVFRFLQQPHPRRAENLVVMGVRNDGAVEKTFPLEALHTARSGSGQQLETDDLPGLIKHTRGDEPPGEWQLILKRAFYHFGLSVPGGTGKKQVLLHTITLHVNIIHERRAFVNNGLTVVRGT